MLPVGDLFIDSLSTVTSMSTFRFKVLLAGDSRLRHLGDYLVNDTDINYVIVPMSGADLVDSVKYALANDPESYDYIVISAGICNLTKRDNRTRQIVVRPTEPDSIINHLHENLQLELAKLWQLNNKVTILPVYGLDLIKYNCHTFDRKYTGPIPNPDQKELDLTAVRLTKSLITLNKWMDSVTIFTANKVNREHGRKKRIQSNYDLLWDGCHPTDFLLLVD